MRPLPQLHDLHTDAAVHFVGIGLPLFDDTGRVPVALMSEAVICIELERLKWLRDSEANAPPAIDDLIIEHLIMCPMCNAARDWKRTP
jgi:hypothetical protein